MPREKYCPVAMAATSNAGAETFLDSIFEHDDFELVADTEEEVLDWVPEQLSPRAAYEIAQVPPIPFFHLPSLDPPTFDSADGAEPMPKDFEEAAGFAARRRAQDGCGTRPLGGGHEETKYAKEYEHPTTPPQAWKAARAPWPPEQALHACTQTPLSVAPSLTVVPISAPEGPPPGAEGPQTTRRTSRGREDRERETPEKFTATMPRPWAAADTLGDVKPNANDDKVAAEEVSFSTDSFEETGAVLSEHPEKGEPTACIAVRLGDGDFEPSDEFDGTLSYMAGDVGVAIRAGDAHADMMLRTVFFLLDRDGDGIISANDAMEFLDSDVARTLITDGVNRDVVGKIYKELEGFGGRLDIDTFLRFHLGGVRPPHP